MADVIGKYLAVEEQPREGRKTKRWTLQNKRGDYLGQILWEARWRQYTFEGDYGCIFSPDCLRDIAAFLERENKAHKEEAKQRG